MKKIITASRLILGGFIILLSLSVISCKKEEKAQIGILEITGSITRDSTLTTKDKVTISIYNSWNNKLHNIPYKTDSGYTDTKGHFNFTYFQTPLDTYYIVAKGLTQGKISKADSSGIVTLDNRTTVPLVLTTRGFLKVYVEKDSAFVDGASVFLFKSELDRINNTYFADTITYGQGTTLTGGFATFDQLKAGTYYLSAKVRIAGTDYTGIEPDGKGIAVTVGSESKVIIIVN